MRHLKFENNGIIKGKLTITMMDAAQQQPNLNTVSMTDVFIRGYSAIIFLIHQKSNFSFELIKFCSSNA